LISEELPYSKTQVWDFTGEPVEGEGIVEFRLLYGGRLLGASRNDTRAKMKHELRREFHPQLRQLWASNRNLDEYARHQCGWYTSKIAQENSSYTVAQNKLQSMTNEDFRKIGIEGISHRWERNGFFFVPLITEELALRCSIDILFLRPENPKFVMQSGDLDARVKTVFDALRIPANLDETGGMGPQEDEKPFYVLLEDDKLISEIRVTCDELLTLPKERAMNPNDSFLVIQVRLKMISRTSSNTLSYLFD
jgi:hypothetical protein